MFLVIHHSVWVNYDHVLQKSIVVDNYRSSVDCGGGGVGGVSATVYMQSCSCAHWSGCEHS